MFNVSALEPVVRRCSEKKVILKVSKNSTENICARVFFLNKESLFKKGTLAQAFSCEFCKIFENTYFTEHLLLTAP